MSLSKSKLNDRSLPLDKIGIDSKSYRFTTNTSLPISDDGKHAFGIIRRSRFEFIKFEVTLQSSNIFKSQQNLAKFYQDSFPPKNVTHRVERSRRNYLVTTRSTQCQYIMQFSTPTRFHLSSVSSLVLQVVSCRKNSFERLCYDIACHFVIIFNRCHSFSSSVTNLLMHFRVLLRCRSVHLTSHAFEHDQDRFFLRRG